MHHQSRDRELLPVLDRSSEWTEWLGGWSSFLTVKADAIKNVWAKLYCCAPLVLTVGIYIELLRSWLVYRDMAHGREVLWKMQY